MTMSNRVIEGTLRKCAVMIDQSYVLVYRYFRVKDVEIKPLWQVFPMYVSSKRGKVQVRVLIFCYTIAHHDGSLSCSLSCEAFTNWLFICSSCIIYLLLLYTFLLQKFIVVHAFTLLICHKIVFALFFGLCASMFE